MKTKLTACSVVLITALLTERTRTNAGEPAPPNMAVIPGGPFQMGDPFNDGILGLTVERPVHTVYVSAFYLDKYEVTKDLWNAVYRWANKHGYWFDYPGEGRGPNYPVHRLNWYDAVKWCNARSEKEGRIPAYYTSAAQTTVYRTGRITLQNDWVKWNAGYRLPTEAEWEKAARGDLSDKRFPWGNTISHERANYLAYPIGFPYDVNLTEGYHPAFYDGASPFIYTSPVGYFEANGYGLYDMAGNVFEWCWDWNALYSSDAQINPHGPASGEYRVVRGGCWSNNGAYDCRVADRPSRYTPDMQNDLIGLRSVLPGAALDPIQVITTPTIPPTYGECPTKEDGKDSLVVVTHGWNSTILNPPLIFPPDVSWVDNMSNNISGYLRNKRVTNWQVHGFKWLRNSWTLFPTHALNNAKQEGLRLGNCISTQGWNHIHLIGHSAGAGLIQAATEVIKPNSPNTTVHCTFLDAYVGKHYEKAQTYGAGTDWSDSYFSRDAITTFGRILTGPFTESPLDHAYNADVTWLDPNKIIGAKFRSSATGEMEPCIRTYTSHGWPIDFYSNTITGNTNFDYAGFGFQLSKEGGNWYYATNNYAPGNGTTGNPIPTQALGPPDPTCITEIQLTPQVWPSWLTDLTTWPTVQSTGGSVEKGNGWTILNPGSPVWLATFVSPTNPVNTVSFDAMFVSTNGSDSLLSVYWETSVIGTVDELYVQRGFQHYSLSFPNAQPNNTYVFGLRLDPFTNALSSVILTNVVFTQIGMSQPFSLLVVTNTGNGLLVYELVGEPGFEYNVQASTNLLDWTGIAILANTSGMVKFFDITSTNYSKRYYRAIVPY